MLDFTNDEDGGHGGHGGDHRALTAMAVREMSIFIEKLEDSGHCVNCGIMELAALIAHFVGSRVARDHDMNMKEALSLTTGFVTERAFEVEEKSQR